MLKCQARVIKLYKGWSYPSKLRDPYKPDIPPQKFMICFLAEIASIQEERSKEFINISCNALIGFGDHDKLGHLKFPRGSDKLSILKPHDKITFKIHEIRKNGNCLSMEDFKSKNYPNEIDNILSTTHFVRWDEITREDVNFFNYIWFRLQNKAVMKIKQFLFYERWGWEKFFSLFLVILTLLGFGVPAIAEWVMNLLKKN